MLDDVENAGSGCRGTPQSPAEELGTGSLFGGGPGSSREGAAAFPEALMAQEVQERNLSNGASGFGIESSYAVTPASKFCHLLS